MCGIAGFAGGPMPREEAAMRVRAMCDAIALHQVDNPIAMMKMTIDS